MESSTIGLVTILYGVFCALWAQNSGRSALLWFFLGLFGHVVTCVVLLAKNSTDRKIDAIDKIDETS